MLTFATKTPSTGANGQKAEGTFPFVRAVLKKAVMGRDRRTLTAATVTDSGRRELSRLRLQARAHWQPASESDSECPASGLGPAAATSTRRDSAGPHGGRRAGARASGPAKVTARSRQVSESSSPSHAGK